MIIVKNINNILYLFYQASCVSNEEYSLFKNIVCLLFIDNYHIMNDWPLDFHFKVHNCLL